MTKKQAVIVIVLALVVLGGLALGVVFRNGQVSPDQNNPAGMNGNMPQGTITSGTTVLYNPTVPANATATVPVQSISAASGTQGAVDQNVYNITASATGYSPANLTVRPNQIVTINFTSQGGHYDIFSQSLGFYIDAASGATTKFPGFSSGNTPGTFLFTCRDYCPSAGKISGTVVVLPK